MLGSAKNCFVVTVYSGNTGCSLSSQNVLNVVVVKAYSFLFVCFSDRLHEWSGNTLSEHEQSSNLTVLISAKGMISFTIQLHF